MRMIPVSDHTKLFQALETLLSGFKSLEQLDDFVQESYERVILHVDDASNIDIINVESHNNEEAKKFGIKIREEANVQQTRACSFVCPLGKKVRGRSNFTNDVIGFRERRVIILLQLTTGGGGWSVDC